ncbi:hypothetical protein DDA98_10735 [Clostridium perfringens]|uniref:hypothetical protein n=1 Tax=Clostridium perfringens TaxID=1502 RepID=UPI000D506AD0|nr:hypothetical protein [Clostridium perfringens]PVE15299.1 hypothetical protein DDA98_10735 [Clostridium perfringens]
MDYWILLEGDKPITKIEIRSGYKTNNLPFTYDEAIKLNNSKYTSARCINISKDIRNQGIIIDNELPLEEEQKIFNAWNSAFLDKSINGFSMPKYVENNDSYITELKKIFFKYKKEMQKIAFKHEEDLADEVINNCNMILEALTVYLDGDENKAKKIIKSLIKKYINNPFWVSDLDKSYAFRGVAPFEDLHSEGYEEKYNFMLENDINFYRARVGNIERDRKQVLHIPYNLLHLVTEQRFSLSKQPCLYLGTTSYVCWTECREPNLENFYVAGFKANTLGKRLKVFNLVASEALVNGISNKNLNEHSRKKIQISMLKLLPMVFATSFSINDESRKEKYEYIIPQLVMQSLSELNIDGIAYLSKRGKDDFQYPQGVNLAIPILDISYKKQYGEVCDKFVITEPRRFNEYKGNDSAEFKQRSYINETFSDYFSTKDYNKNFSQYSKVDDIISRGEYKHYN